MEKNLKRVNLMIREEQAERVSQEGLNLSGLVRDLLDDHFSEHKIVISVSEETRSLYDQIVSNTGSTDEEVEMFLKQALREMLKSQIAAMIELEKRAF